MDKIQNPFWKSFAVAYSKWYIALKKSKEIDLADAPIWGNSHLNLRFNIKNVQR